MTDDLVTFLQARLEEDERDPGGWPERRVLAEVDAKRRLINGLVEIMEGDYAPWNEGLLRLLALPYADHPDYQHEWAPSA